MAEAKTDERKPWDQLEGESNEAYARFLVYRNLGPTRSVLLAYAALRPDAPESKKKQTRSASRIWWDNYRAFHWKDRAAAWDVAQLVYAVPEAAAAIFKLIGETAKACLAEVANGNIKPQSFAELREMVVILAGFISPEVISTTINHAGNAEDWQDGG
jgi:hypothetical protein